MTNSSTTELRMRITVRRPPRDVALAVQRGRDELLEPAKRSPGALVFDFLVNVSPAAVGKPPSLRGPYVHGPAGARFIYLNSGTRAGQADSPWNRRAKLPLVGITPAMIAAALRSPSARIETTVDGTASDDGPVVATLKAIEWRVS